MFSFSKVFSKKIWHTGTDKSCFANSAKMLLTLHLWTIKWSNSNNLQCFGDSCLLYNRFCKNNDFLPKSKSSVRFWSRKLGKHVFFAKFNTVGQCLPWIAVHFWLQCTFWRPYPKAFRTISKKIIHFVRSLSRAINRLDHKKCFKNHVCLPFLNPAVQWK